MSATVFFTSDLHLGHNTPNILKFRSKIHGVDFYNADIMNEWIIDNLNDHLTKKDHLVITGDVAFNAKALKLLKDIKGTKTLVLGNHDKQATAEYMKYFGKLHGLLRKYECIFSHCPLHPQELLYRKWCLNVHGHIHHVEKDIQTPNYLNVNMDVMGIKPLSLDELKQKRAEAAEWFEQNQG